MQQNVYGRRGRPELVRFVPTSTRSALDVGCGGGDFASDLRTVLPPETVIHGIEANAEAAVTARTVPSMNEVFGGYFPEVLAERPDRYDLISFNDVLEHVVDPWQMLRDAKEFLTPTGRVLASIPNVQHITVIGKHLLGRWTYTETGILDRTHLRFFDKRGVRALFADAGYVIERIEGINSVGWESEERMTGSGRGLFAIAGMRVGRVFLGDSAHLQYAVLARPIERVPQ